MNDNNDNNNYENCLAMVMMTMMMMMMTTTMAHMGSMDRPSRCSALVRKVWGALGKAYQQNGFEDAIDVNFKASVQLVDLLLDQVGHADCRAHVWAGHASADHDTVRVSVDHVQGLVNFGHYFHGAG